MRENVLARLRSTRPSLSPALSRIAEHVLERPGDVIHQTITEVADQAGSSEASVLRFCRDLKFTSFQRFKMALAIELSVKQAVARPSPSGDALDYSVASAMTAIEQTRELLDRAELKKVAKHLAKASSIDLYALGASVTTAGYGAYRLLRLGLTSRVFVDPNLAVMSAIRLGAKDVAIGISVSGSTKDTAGVLKAAKGAGAFTVAITNHLRSPLTSIPDAILCASSSETPLTGGAFPSIVGQLMIVDVLTNLIGKSNSKFESAIRQTAEAAIDTSF